MMADGLGQTFFRNLSKYLKNYSDRERITKIQRLNQASHACY